MARRPTTKTAKAKTKLGRKPPPEGETRRDRFMRIGQRRMNNVIRQIQLLGNLCGPNYECEPNDLASMRAAIVRELDMSMARFTPRKREGEKPAFSFASASSANTQH